MSKKKTETAVARREPEAETAVVQGAVVIPMGQSITTDDLTGFDIEHVVTLEEGKGIRGRFKGPGATMQITDEQTGEVRDIRTWLIGVPGGTARLMGSAGLDKHFEGKETTHEGKECVVVRGPQVNTRRGRRVNTYMVGWEKSKPHAVR